MTSVLAKSSRRSMLLLRGATHGSRSISTRVAAIGNNVFAEISLLAAQHGAVNLGQGFPSFHTPPYVWFFLPQMAIVAGSIVL